LAPGFWMVDPASARELRDLLTARGFAEESVKTLVLGWVVAEVARHETHADNYWEATYAPTEQDLAGRLERDSLARRILSDLYGSEASTDPAFASLFRPLGPALGFLTSAQQLQLQRLQAEALHAVNRQYSGSCSQERPAAGIDSLSHQDEWLGKLDEASRIEYLLRFSPLSRRIRASRVVDNESDFRRVFEIARPLLGSVSPERLAEVRKQLRQVLGNSGFDRFWAAQDPFHAELSRYLLAEGHDAGEIEAAYGVLNDSQDTILQTLARGATQSQLSAVAADVRSRELSLLTNILGEQTAGRLQMKQSELAMQLAGADSLCR
jgi:hypothetical protein